MDWIRLGSSGVDLAGTNGKVAPVSHAELSKHNTREDAWMAVKGKVFNVTRYLDFHPGGVDELMKGVGTDATKLFEETHAWVNYEQLLAKCYVGPLRNTAVINLKSFGNKSNLSPAKNDFKTPSLLSVSSESLTATETIKSLIVGANVQTPVEILPRFDWIQKTSNLILVFYTKSLCNPGVIIEQICDKEIYIRILLVNNSVYEYKFSLSKDVRWPCQAKVSQETGKIELVFNKVDAALWTTFGTYDRQKITDFIGYDFDYELQEKTEISHDSYALSLRPKTKLLQIVPIGYHFSITGKIFGEICFN